MFYFSYDKQIPTPTLVSGLVKDWKDIVNLSAGSRYIAGLKYNGTVEIVALNESSQNVGGTPVQDWKNIVSISCGESHIVGLQNDGNIVVYGSNLLRQCDV